jgi:predicted component of type VI protein secretion system
VATVASTPVAERFLRALDRRDFDDIASCFAPDARLRALVPSNLRDDEGSAAIAERFRFWLSEFTEFAVTDSEADQFMDLLHIRYRMRALDPEDGDVTCEQHAYLTLENGAISAMNLVCSGWRPAL